MLDKSIGLVVAVSLATSGCSDEESAPPVALSVVTYNAGLAVGFVEAAEPRAPLVIEAIAALDADVICLQEVWRPDHVDQLKAAAAARFPHALFLEPDPGTTGAAACSDADLVDLAACAEQNGCPEVCTDDLVTCVLTNCGQEFGAVPADCNACLQANVGKAYDDVLATCTSESTEYAFGGSFGIGLLSRFPISGQSSTVFESTTNRRAVIQASLATDLGPATAFCTHLSAVFADIPHPGEPDVTWEIEQAAQIDQLVALTQGASGLTLVMGDTNTGPAGDGYVAEVPENYQKFLAAGLSNPYTSLPGHLCTFCADNPIVAKGNDDTLSVLIDHVLVRGLPPEAQVAGRRLLDQGITVDNCGAEIATALSDHYGVHLTFTQ
jgi:endonuclease/exonuclease/phosphatase family metal-dependent hydrolase